MTVRDGIAIFTAKTVTNREYIDNKLKEYDLKQTIQNINATVNSEYADAFSCVKIGHFVQIVFKIKKTATGITTIASGLPKPVVGFIFNKSINGNDGKSLRFEMTTAGVLRFNHTSEYTTSHGKEFSTSFTYLTSD